MVGTTISHNLASFSSSTRSSQLESTSTVLGANYSPYIFKQIVSDFMKKLNYSPPVSDNTPDIKKTQTYQSLHSDLSAYNKGDKWFEATVLTAASLAELPYPNHCPNEKLQIAKFSWYLLYVDDIGDKIPSDLRAFQQGLFTNQSYENPVLQGFRQHLADMYQLWDPIGANCISAAGVEFVTGRLIEEEPTIRDMEVSHIASSWPNFLRVKTGGAAAYAFMLFPKASFPDMSMYIQVVDDISFIVNHVNDLLSYHKEALAGETNNYIHARAHVTRNTVAEALQGVANDLLAANSRITHVLQNTEGAATWKHFMVGLLDFHFVLKRYRLSELNF